MARKIAPCRPPRSTAGAENFARRQSHHIRATTKCNNKTGQFVRDQSIVW
jgi:hypothetical protein